MFTKEQELGSTDYNTIIDKIKDILKELYNNSSKKLNRINKILYKTVYIRLLSGIVMK